MHVTALPIGWHSVLARAIVQANAIGFLAVYAAAQSEHDVINDGPQEQVLCP